MGKCISKPEKSKPRGNTEKYNFMYYKPKVSSSSLLCCRLTDKTFKEIPILSQLNFQTASLFRKLDSIRYVCIGGLDNGEQALLLNLLTSTCSQINPPPMSLAYGNIIPYDNRLYTIGSLTIETSGEEKPAPPLVFDISGHRWSELPEMPAKLSLCGSYSIGKDLYVLGGYLNYPDYPSHFRAMLILDLVSHTWMRSNIETPVLEGLPACCVINEQEVLVIGGHDPCERITDVESHKTYLFTGSSFEVCPDIPAVGQLRFLESPVCHRDQVFIFSDDDILFIFNLLSKEWSYIDCEQSILKSSDNLDAEAYVTMRTYLYRYIMEECEIVEYNISFGTSRKTGPSSFKYSYKYTGMCVMEDGRLLFAGGITEEQLATRSTWALNPKGGATSSTADLPWPQYGVRMVAVSGVVYAMAGIENDSDKYVSRCQKYVVAKDKWEELPAMECTAFLPGICYYDGKIYTIGGRTDGDVYFIVQAFDIARSVWEMLDVDYPVSAMGVGAINVFDKILCFGGKDASGCKVYDSFLFDGNEFRPVDDLPNCGGEDSTFFLDPVVCSMGKVYAVSVEGNLFSHADGKWTVLYTNN